MAITHWYEQHSGIQPAFLKAIVLFQHNDFSKALAQFAQADLLTAPDDHYCYLYLAYHGLTRIILGYVDGVEQCRYAGHFEQFEADVHHVVALAEMRLSNRARALSAIRTGLSIEADHHRLLKLREQLGWRRKVFFKFLVREHYLNRLLGQITYRGTG